MSNNNNNNNIKDINNVHRYHRKKGIEDMDYMTILCLVVGMIALFTESKVISWISLLVWLSAFANLRTLDGDYKQLFSAFLFSFMGLFMRYFSAPRRQTNTVSSS